MTNKKTTKRALLASVLSIVICLTMLIGSTFAWFTDTATTGVNTIKSGNLNVELQMSYDNGATWEDAENKTLEFRDKNGKSNILWEPGAEFKLPQLRIKNAGNLALKYKIVVSGLTGDMMLADVLDVNLSVNGASKNTVGTLTQVIALNAAEVDGLIHGELAATDTSDVYEVSLKMQEKADNDYMNKTLSGLSITVYATQDTVEWDSWTNQYDKDSEYDPVGTKVSNESELALAFEKGDDSIILEKDIKVSSTYNITENSDTVIYGEGHTISRADGNTKAIFSVPATATLDLNDVKLDGGAEAFEIDMSGYPAIVEDSLANIVKTTEPAIVSYGTLNADGATFANNYADGYNSSIRILAGTAEFNDCTFSHNYSANFGAAVGVGVDSGTVTQHDVQKVVFKNCTFDGNITNKGGAGGGALYIVNTAEAFIQSCEFIDNCGMAYNCGGGAIFFGRNGSYSITNSMKDSDPANDLAFTKAYIDDCLFKGNHSGNDGAAIHSESADLYITNTKFIGNYGHSGNSSVGTISCMPDAADGKNPPIFLNCSIDNCEFTGNSLGGGAVFGNHATAVILKLTNSVIKDNKGTSDLLIYEGDNLIENCKFTENELTKAVFDIRTVDERYADVVIKDVTIETAEGVPGIMLDAQKGLNATCHIQGTTTAKTVVKTSSGVSKFIVEGTLNGDITYDANTSAENIIVEQGATHNGTITKSN